jgi:hypothetical protein
MNDDVPLIFGIPFCRDLQPFVEWKSNRLFVKNGDHFVELQTTSIDKHTT